MKESAIARINELARKSRTPEGLTEAERQEQATLRAEYVSSFRNSLKSQLDNTVIVDDKGNRRKLEQKNKI